ncbi:MAG: hypothetical protein DMG79_06120 [Acidobacteria bacterium]|nr:MAG: hypothetical protein DMG79_06120 [Acidobacteriota bacterium]
MIASKAWRKLRSTDGLDTVRGVPGCLVFFDANGYFEATGLDPGRYVIGMLTMFASLLDIG